MPYKVMSNKNLLGAIADLRAAAAQMRSASSAKASPSNKASKNRRKRAARRAAKAANGFTNGSSGSLVSAPAAMSRQLGPSAPNVSAARDRSGGLVVVVKHREYIAEVPGATAWTVTSYVIQPALQTLFVWLSNLAGNFEKYRIRKLHFLYETECATTQAGSVVFAVDPDALDAAPASKQDALAYQQHMRSAPWQPFRLPVDINSLQKDLYYTRSGAVPSGADAKTYDAGVLHVGVQNSSGSTGELHVEYEIELHTPQPNVTPVSAKKTATTGLDADSLVGTDAAYTTGSNVGWSITDASTLTCTVAGGYLVSIFLTGTVMVGTSLTVGSLSTATVVTSNCRVDTAGTNASAYAVVQAQVGQTLVFAITSATTITASTFRIARYNSALA